MASLFIDLPKIRLSTHVYTQAKHAGARAIKRMIQTRYIYTTRRVDQRLMNDDDITREMHSGRLVGMQQFSDISQADVANSIYGLLDNLLGRKLDRHH